MITKPVPIKQFQPRTLLQSEPEADPDPEPGIEEWLPGFDINDFHQDRNLPIKRFVTRKCGSQFVGPRLHRYYRNKAFFANVPYSTDCVHFEFPEMKRADPLSKKRRQKSKNKKKKMKRLKRRKTEAGGMEFKWRVKQKPIIGSQSNACSMDTAHIWCHDCEAEETGAKFDSQEANKQYLVPNKRDFEESCPRNFVNDAREYKTGGRSRRKARSHLLRKRTTKHCKKIEWGEDVLFGMTIFLEDRI